MTIHHRAMNLITAVNWIEVCEARELVGKLVAQAWVGEDLP